MVLTVVGAGGLGASLELRRVCMQVPITGPKNTQDISGP